MIRRATIHDVDRILSIIRDAQLSLRDLGIDQWQDGYPSRDVIEEDIARCVGYVQCNDENEAVGYAAIVLSGEEVPTVAELHQSRCQNCQTCATTRAQFCLCPCVEWIGTKAFPTIRGPESLSIRLLACDLASFVCVLCSNLT